MIVSPLDDSEHLYPRSVADGAPRTTASILARGCAATPPARSIPTWRARLYETMADLVYIPPGWWHYVEALEGNASVLLPFDMSVAEQQSLPRPWAAPGRAPEGSADEAAAAKATGTAPALPTAADEEEVVEDVHSRRCARRVGLRERRRRAMPMRAERRSRIVMQCATRRASGATRRRSPRLYPR